MIFIYRRFLQAFFSFLLIFTAIPTQPATAEEHVVIAKSGKASDMRFDPPEITIKPGDTVTWVNEKDMYHNIKALKKDIPGGAEPFTSKGIVKKGDKWSYTFTVPGDYNYFCVPHKAMGMVGKIAVSESDTPQENTTSNTTE